jgi:hypothetical protein
MATCAGDGWDFPSTSWIEKGIHLGIQKGFNYMEYHMGLRWDLYGIYTGTTN